MAGDRAAAASVGGFALLERAVNYALGSLHLVRLDALAAPTPCRGWDLGALLDHLDDSMLALGEAGHDRRVRVPAAAGGSASPVDPVETLRGHASDLLGAWTGSLSGTDADCAFVGRFSLSAALVATAGAIELAVHGWDVAQACGHHRPVPAALADEMLDLVGLFVTEADRPVRFGPPVPLARTSSPGDRLVAFLGRDPR